MILFGGLFAVVLMGAVIAMALNKKSNYRVRVASLIALAVMILTMLICLFIVLTDNRVPFDESVVIVGVPPETNEVSRSNIIILLVLIVFLLGLFGVIVYQSLKEHRKSAKNFT